MLRIVDLNKKSEKIIRTILEDISKLKKLNKINPDNKNETKTTINKIHFQLNELELLQGEKIKQQQSTQTNKEKIKINNQLKIKKTKKSKSFINWLFNNKEL